MAGTGFSYRTRRRLSLVVLLVGLPVYVVAAVSLVGLFDRPGILVELLIYVGLGVIWALPLRFVFRGVGRSASDADGPRPALNRAPLLSPRQSGGVQAKRRPMRRRRR